MTLRQKESSLRELSDRIVQLMNLPQGTTIFLVRKDTGRKVRSDMTIRRRAMVAKSFGELDSGDTIGKLLAKLRRHISTDLEARGLVMRISGPQGQWLDPQTAIGPVRLLPAVVGASGQLEEPAHLFVQIVELAGVDDDLPKSTAVSLFNELQRALGPEFAELITRKSKVIQALRASPEPELR